MSMSARPRKRRVRKLAVRLRCPECYTPLPPEWIPPSERALRERQAPMDVTGWRKCSAPGCGYVFAVRARDWTRAA